MLHLYLSAINSEKDYQMVRSLLADMTDYSHQSLTDMIEDLKNWVLNLTETVEHIERTDNILEQKGYWTQPGTSIIRNEFARAYKLFKTSIEELNEVLAASQIEIEENHVSRVRRLGQVASKKNLDLEHTWNNDPWAAYCDYDDSNFRLAEALYIDSAGMTADMVDLQNLADRLKDFVGRRAVPASATQTPLLSLVPNDFVDASRLEELRSIKSRQFDLARLIRLCEELNVCYSNGCYMATAMLTRAILDHVPPVFDLNRFSEIASNYKGSKSFKESMQHLQESLRNIADQHLHTQIRNSENLPTKVQVNFSASVDVLLSEIVRLLK